MAEAMDQRPIAVVTACMRPDGTPAFALCEVAATPEEAANGLHYYLAEAELTLAGYEEPFVHVDQREAPAFLHAALRRHLGLAPAITDPTSSAVSEEPRCPA
jgi:hypothetical protein